MKVEDILEMTLRTSSTMETMPFPDFDKQKLVFEGKMQHGYEVYSFNFENTIIYGVKIENEFASFVQLKSKQISNFGEVLESLNSKTKKEYRGKFLSYKLKFFLNKHLGKSILAGSVHSLNTEYALLKVSHLFDLKMINIKNGEIQDWSEEHYKKLTSKFNKTDWQVLMNGSSTPLKEDFDNYVSWDAENRHVWTYGNYFEEL